MNEKIIAEIEDHSYLLEIKKRINKSAKERQRIHNALGLGIVVGKSNGVYKVFSNSVAVLIKSGNFRRKKLLNLRVKIR